MTPKLILSRFGFDFTKKDVLSHLHKDIISMQDSITSGYHYTTTGNLDKILNSGTFFSTDCRYLNDPNELLIGYKKITEQLSVRKNEYVNSPCVDKIKRIIKKPFTQYDSYGKELSPYIDNFSNLYSICFCSKIDDLNQWDRYAGECGIAIEIDFKYIKENATLALFSNDEKGKGIFIPLDIEPFPIAYLDDDIKKLLNVFIERINSSEYSEPTLLSALSLLAGHIKDSRYQYENEIRYCFFPFRATSSISPHNCELVYTESNHRLIPHVPVYCFPKDFLLEDKNSDSKIESGWPISKIFVGPGRNQQEVYQALIHRLESGTMRIFKYPDSELVKRKMEFNQEAKDAFLKDGGHITKQMKRKYNEIESKASDMEKVLLTQSYKYNVLAPIFEKYEETHYCTALGIRIQKSDLKYNFKV